MRILSQAAFFVVALLLLLGPCVEARRIPTYDFSVGLAAFDPGATTNGKQGNLPPVTLITGDFSAEGTRGGLFAFVNIHSGGVSQADKVEVLNFKDQAAAFRRAQAGQCDTQDSCSVERTFVSPTVSLGNGSTLGVYATNTTITYELGAPFAMGGLMKPPRAVLGELANDLDVEQSLLGVAPKLHASGRVDVAGRDVMAVLANNESTIILEDATGSQAYSTKDRIFRFYGRPSFDFALDGAVVPFVNDTKAAFRRADADIAQDQFRPEVLNEVLKSFGSKSQAFPPDAADRMRELAPVLNGVILGNATEALVKGKNLGSSSLALIRFQHLDIAPNGNSGATAEGRSNFVIVHNSFFTTHSSARLGPIHLPPVSLILWIVAAGAIVAGFVVKPFFAVQQVGAFGLVRILGIGFHFLALAIAFLLWDGEIRNFLGTSLLTLFANGANGAGPLMALAFAFQAVPFLLGYTFFALPVRFLVNTGLKLGGLRRAGGIGKGIGDLAIWGLGAPFIPVFLNGFIGSVLDALQNALPK